MVSRGLLRAEEGGCGKRLLAQSQSTRRRPLLGAAQRGHGLLPGVLCLAGAAHLQPMRQGRGCVGGYRGTSAGVRLRAHSSPCLYLRLRRRRRWRRRPRLSLCLSLCLCLHPHLCLCMSICKCLSTSTFVSVLVSVHVSVSTSASASASVSASSFSFVCVRTAGAGVGVRVCLCVCVCAYVCLCVFYVCGHARMQVCKCLNANTCTRACIHMTCEYASYI